MNTDEHRWNAITEKVIACVYSVSNELGCGFLENVYENAMVVALRNVGLNAQQQVGFKVFYQGVIVGEYIADLVIENTVLVELKAVKALDDIHTAQCLNLLRTTNLPICLLVNFAKPKAEVRRLIWKQPL